MMDEAAAMQQQQMMQDPNMMDMNDQQMMGQDGQQQFMDGQMPPGQYIQEQLDVSTGQVIAMSTDNRQKSSAPFSVSVLTKSKNGNRH